MNEKISAELFDGLKYSIAKATAENTVAAMKRLDISGAQLTNAYTDELMDRYADLAKKIIDQNGYVVVDIAGYKEVVPLIADENKNPCRGYVYIITDGQYVKIGKASNVENRISTLQTGSPRQIVLLQKMEVDDMQRVEESLHIWFEKFYVNGEWFNLLGHFGLDTTDYINVMLGNNTVRHEYVYSVTIANSREHENDARIWIRKPDVAGDAE